MKKHSLSLDHLHASTLRIGRFHYIYVALFVFQTIAYHASKLITPELLLKRWMAAAGLLAATVLVWLIAKNKCSDARVYEFAIGLIILADIAFAAFNVYTQRGYASKAALLFIIPIVVATALSRRSLVLATALLAVAAYTTTAISYFVLNFNEGYMSELYGEIGFYSGIFILIAAMLWSTSHKQN